MATTEAVGVGLRREPGGFGSKHLGSTGREQEGWEEAVATGARFFPPFSPLSRPVACQTRANPCAADKSGALDSRVSDLSDQESARWAAVCRSPLWASVSSPTP